MDVMFHSSTLNPNAPLFVPLAYRTVEDFSDQWWTLVRSSPWFRDYWLQERYFDPQTDPLINDIYDPADDLDSFFFDEDNTLIYREENEHGKDLVSMGALKWQMGRTQLDRATRYVEKPPRIVNVKVSPRMIQQPR